MRSEETVFPEPWESIKIHGIFECTKKAVLENGRKKLDIMGGLQLILKFVSYNRKYITMINY